MALRIYWIICGFLMLGLTALLAWIGDPFWWMGAIYAVGLGAREE